MPVEFTFDLSAGLGTQQFCFFFVHVCVHLTFHFYYQIYYIIFYALTSWPLLLIA